MKKFLFIALLAIGPLFGNAQIATSYSLGDGFTVAATDSSFSTTFFGRFQSRFTSFAPAPDLRLRWNEFESDFNTNRARLGLKGYLWDANITYRLEVGFGQGDVPAANNVLDASLGWKFYRGFEIRFGQAVLPGNRERMVYSRNLQLVARSAFNEKFNLDRDLGMQLRHSITLGKVVLREVLAASQGDGLGDNAGNQGGYDYTVRLEVLPFGEFSNNGDTYYADLEREETPKLAIGVVYD